MIRLVKTCEACPEQYDAFLGEKQVGYLRLRHGRFTVHCPGVGGEMVYDTHTVGDGCFTPEERSREIDQALEAIKTWLRTDSVTGEISTTYDNFSMKQIEYGIRCVFANIKNQTGATDAELLRVFGEVATKIMKTNFLKR